MNRFKEVMRINILISAALVPMPLDCIQTYVHSIELHTRHCNQYQYPRWTDRYRSILEMNYGGKNKLLYSIVVQTSASMASVSPTSAVLSASHCSTN